jgi:hypothetical protein
LHNKNLISEEGAIFLDNDRRGGYKDNADDTVAINLLAAGQAVSACGDMGPVAEKAQ